MLERLPESERRPVHGGRQHYKYLEIELKDGPRGVAVTRAAPVLPGALGHCFGRDEVCEYFDVDDEDRPA